jgi:type IV secretion system protein VirB10
MDPNLQLRKRQFLDDEPLGGVRSTHSVEDPRSPWQVMAGTIIPASLVTGLNSDLPGMVIAQVTQPVHDTVTGQRLLIPQGSRLIGRYQSEISFGQDRALIVWERLIFPDGASVMMSEPAVDATGHAGLSDQTDQHWDRMFAAAGLATLLGVGAELGTDRHDDIARAIRRGASDTVNQAGQRVVDRTLGIQPTIRVRPGWSVNVLVTRDLILRPYPLGGTP